MRIHYLQHVSFEGLGYIETWLTAHGHTLSATRFYEEGYVLPALDQIDALVIMGGPMGVYDEEVYPWLLAEKLFIQACIRADIKLLGICLGAQLIAAAMGARVVQAQHKEIGWFPLQPTDACKDIPWLYSLFIEQPVVFHWHGDRFEIPVGAKLLLNSAANTNQAFIYNKQVIGLQCHFEATTETVALMLEHGAAELQPLPYVQSAEDIKKGIPYISNAQVIMAQILTHWLN